MRKYRNGLFCDLHTCDKHCCWLKCSKDINHCNYFSFPTCHSIASTVSYRHTFQYSQNSRIHMDMVGRVALYVCMFCMFQHGPFVLKRMNWERLLSHFVGMTLLAFVNLSLPVLPDWKRQQHEKSEIVAEAFPMLSFCIPSVCCAPNGNPIVVAFTTTTTTMLNEKMVNYWWPKVDNLIDIIYYRNDFFMKRARWRYWFTVDTGTWLNSFQLPKSYILPTSSIGCLPNFGAVYPNI